jgi:hypothetical protein
MSQASSSIPCTSCRLSPYFLFFPCAHRFDRGWYYAASLQSAASLSSDALGSSSSLSAPGFVSPTSVAWNSHGPARQASSRRGRFVAVPRRAAAARTSRMPPPVVAAAPTDAPFRCSIARTFALFAKLDMTTGARIDCNQQHTPEFKHIKGLREVVAKAPDTKSPCKEQQKVASPASYMGEEGDEEASAWSSRGVRRK